MGILLSKSLWDLYRSFKTLKKDIFYSQMRDKYFEYQAKCLCIRY